MGKLFISYAHEDRPIAAALDAALSRDGHEVWWDRELATGAGAFRPQIQRELDAADLVVVIWTARSRVSRFVADEADIALSQGKLLSVLVDGTRPALGFGAIHGVDLGSWNGPDDDEGLVPLQREISRRIADGPVPTPRRPALRVFGAAIALCVTTALGFGLAQGVSLAFRDVTWVAMLRFGLEHAAYALALSVPVAAFAAVRSRRFGFGRLRAVSRPFLQVLIVGFVLALILGLLALANGADADQPAGQRVQRLVSIVLFATLAAAASISTVRLLLMLARRHPV